MTKSNINQILDKLPAEMAVEIRRLPVSVLEGTEELRIRCGQPVLLYSGGKEYALNGYQDGRCSRETVDGLFHSVLNHSAYAYQEELSSGYVTMEGGHRVGVCGRMVMENGRVRTIKDVSSLNIRRSRELPGIAGQLVPYLLDDSGRPYNTVIVSPPKCGKTTLLRDVIRSFSNRGLKVGVCDERSEIAGTYQGKATYDLGSRTDVLDGCPKALGMVMLIRSMSPDVIATDEIGKREDSEAVEAAVCAGVGLITTIHGSGMEDLLSSGIGDAVRKGVFQRFVFLTNRPSTGTISQIRKWKGAAE